MYGMSTVCVFAGIQVMRLLSQILPRNYYLPTWTILRSPYARIVEQVNLTVNISLIIFALVA